MRVSFVIPSRNEATDIAGTLDAVTALPYEDKEILVIDDSTDGTRAVVQQYARRGVQLIYPGGDRCQARNIGMVHNYEAVIGASRGDYVKLLCADDVLYPGAIRRELETLSDAGPGIAMVAARRDVVVEGWGRLPRLSSGARRGPTSGRGRGSWVHPHT